MTSTVTRDIYRLGIICAIGILLLVTVTVQYSREIRSSGFGDRPQKSRPRIDTSQLPVIDFDAQDSSTSIEGAERKKKGKRYNGRNLKDSPSSDLSIATSHWLVKLPALPISNSNLIVIGTVLQAQGFLSEDKTGVYSEFTVHIEETLKSDGNIPAAINDLIPLEREGGRIRYPSGRIRALVLEYQGTPLVSHKYLFFIRREAGESNNLIVTAYDIVNGKVVPLDGRSLGDGRLLPQFAPFDGITVEQLLTQVRTAVNTANQSSF